jgi:hypothetical protein
VVVDAGENLALGAVVQQDPADHVHLPELHGAPAFPALVGGEALAGRFGLDESVAHQGPVDARARWDRIGAVTGELMLEPDLAPVGLLSA